MYLNRFVLLENRLTRQESPPDQCQTTPLRALTRFVSQEEGELRSALLSHTSPTRYDPHTRSTGYPRKTREASAGSCTKAPACYSSGFGVLSGEYRYYRSGLNFTSKSFIGRRHLNLNQSLFLSVTEVLSKRTNHTIPVKASKNIRKKICNTVAGSCEGTLISEYFVVKMQHRQANSIL